MALKRRKLYYKMQTFLHSHPDPKSSADIENHERVKGSVSSSIPCTRRLLVGLCLSPFSWPMKMGTTMANQETTRARHAG